MDQQNIEQQEIESEPQPIKLNNKEQFSEVEENQNPVDEPEEKLIGIGVSSEVYLISSPKQSPNSSYSGSNFDFTGSSPQNSLKNENLSGNSSPKKSHYYIAKKFNKKWSLKDIQREAELQQKAESDNVIKILQIQNRAILMEYASNGELLEYVKRAKLSEKLARTYFIQLIQGMVKLHQLGIAHRDIKLDNLLLSDNFSLKIADFGWATEYQQNQLLSERSGTEANLAPEIIDYKAYMPEKIDVFACGVVLFQLVCGQSPISQKAKKTDKIYKYFANNMSHKIWKQLKEKKNTVVSDEFKNLIELMINYNHKQRPTFKQILEHDWVKKQPIYTEQKEIKQEMQSIYIHKIHQIMPKKLNNQNLKLINMNSSFHLTDSNSITNQDSPFSPEKSFGSHYNYNILNLNKNNSSIHNFNSGNNLQLNLNQKESTNSTINNNSNHNLNINMLNNNMNNSNTNPFHSSNFSYGNSIFANYNIIQPQESQDYKTISQQFQNLDIQSSNQQDKNNQEEEEIKEM